MSALPQQTEEDKDRERRILESYLALTTAKDRDGLKRHSDAMLAEINRRSAEQVARMERERGLV